MKKKYIIERCTLIVKSSTETSGVLKLKEKKIMFEFITTVLRLNLDLLFTSAYTLMITIYVTIYLEREKRLKSLDLLVLWVKGVISPPLWYTWVLWVWGLPYHLVVTPLVDLWSFIFYLVLSPLLCVVTWPPLVWWLKFITFVVLLLCDHMTFGTLLWVYSTLFYVFIMVTTLNP